MKVGIVGPSYEQRSIPFDAQRAINLFPVTDQQGKEVSALYGTPGKSLFSTAGSGPVRGGFISSNGRAFFVSGDVLYEINSAGTATSWGTLNTTSGNVTIDENSIQLFICDGEDGYVFTYSTDSFTEVTDGDFPQAGTATCIDGYIVVNETDSGRFYISSNNNGLNWDALDFATAESSPDQLVRVIRAVGQLWLLGDKTTEIWTNTGDASFPFQKIKGSEIEIGIMAAHTALAFGNSLFWVGKDRDGDGIVYTADGFRPRRISTEAIEIRINSATDKENIRAFSYQKDGHFFYILTGGGLETSLAYDLTTGQWHERAYLNAQGEFEQDLASCCVSAFGKHLVGDRRNGKIYELSQDVYSDNGDEIASERIFTHLSNEDQRQRYNELVIAFEHGVGITTGQGSDPVCMLKISKDGGRTYSDWYTASIGKKGEYKNKTRFRRIGIAEQLTLKVRITDPVKRVMIGAYMR